jgi:outer membrane murein-binding lipoprotein Lpp
MQKNAAIRKLSSLVEEKQKEIESARKELDSAKKELDALRALQTLKNEPKP